MNEIYDQLADSWWDENGTLHLLKAMVNPWRVPYFRKLLSRQFRSQLNTTTLLDIGSGGGLLAEEFANLGIRVTGIDLSIKSLAAANHHAKESNLEISYCSGSGTALPFPDASFDIVSCCDVLEHIPDWQAAIREAARLLKPGGVFLFDTINRTLFSYLVLILGAQELPFSRILPKGTHVWNMFITLSELRQALSEVGLSCQEITGGVLALNPIRFTSTLIKLKTGKITVKEFGEQFPLKLSGKLTGNYIGWAGKAAHSAE